MTGGAVVAAGGVDVAGALQVGAGELVVDGGAAEVAGGADGLAEATLAVDDDAADSECSDVSASPVASGEEGLDAVSDDTAAAAGDGSSVPGPVPCGAHALSRTARAAAAAMRRPRRPMLFTIMRSGYA